MMSQRALCVGVLACLSVLATGSMASGALVYGTPASLTGNRVVGNPGLVITDLTDHANARVDWSIVLNPNFTYTYTYTFTNIARPTLSHFTLDLSDDALSGSTFLDPLVVTGATMDGNPIVPGKIIPFGGTMDGIVGGVKFDIGTEEATVVFSFTSNRSPVWGDFFVKAGSSDVYNSGRGDMLLEDVGHYIARPNGAVPEPSAAGVLVGAVAALLRRRRK